MKALLGCLVGTTLLLSSLSAAAPGTAGKTPPTVAELIKQLGAEEWPKREDASKELNKRMDLKLYAELRKVETKDLEIKRRIERILRRFEGNLDLETYRATKDGHLQSCYKKNLFWATKPWPKAYPFLPWIDMREDGGSTHPWLANAQKKVGVGCSPHWHDYRHATDLWLEEEIKARIEEVVPKAKSEKEVRTELAKMRDDLQKKIDAMALKEDKYWGGAAKNPVRQWWRPLP